MVETLQKNSTADIPPLLMSEIEKRVTASGFDDLAPVVDEITGKYGSAVKAILFYGSCLQKADVYDGLVDLYVIVDSYHNASKNRVAAAFNRLLPPNVYYLEVTENDRLIRVKYAVISLDQFQKGCSEKWFHSSLWARFVQPSAILYVSDEEVRLAVIHSIARAVITFLKRVIPCASCEFTAMTLYAEGLALSYRAELRPEKQERIKKLVEAGAEWFNAICVHALSATGYALNPLPGTDPQVWLADIDAGSRRRCRFEWRLRQAQGKVLSVLRLFKAAFTFSGGVDYALGKIERHSGIKIEATPFMRRHPVLAMLVLWLRVLRKGAVR